MVRFKGLTFLIVAITSLKSLNYYGSNGIIIEQHETAMTAKGSQMRADDTLLLSIKDYKVVSLEEHVLDIEVINNQLVDLIKNVKYTIIKIELPEGNRIAKGNDLLSSSIPKACDYFYPLVKGYVSFVNNRINFRKVPGKIT
ncbi:hypothetical protein [Chitinophaga sp.]|uniref:hypothetical protein n=1 Tax=Chitinophaga sp. TaxID=1869181 RepID=UPI0031E31AA3